MAVPTTRQEFIDYCLRRLGAPVLCINVDDEQIEDRVDEALLYYYDYHFDGTQRVYIRHQITQADIDNEYITLANNVIAVVDLLPIGSTTTSSNLFNLRYQLHLNDLYYTSATSTIPYYIAHLHIAHLEELFVGRQQLRYNRHVNQLRIDMDWTADVTVGDHVIIDAYQITDPNVYPDVWGDRWLQRYASALIKRQWAQNLIKFEGMQLPGGVQFNGMELFNQAQTEIDNLEEEMIVSYSLPVSDMVG